jgi:hypothetical protein
MHALHHPGGPNQSVSGPRSLPRVADLCGPTGAVSRIATLQGLGFFRSPAWLLPDPSDPQDYMRSLQNMQHVMRMCACRHRTSRLRVSQVAISCINRPLPFTTDDPNVQRHMFFPTTRNRQSSHLSDFSVTAMCVCVRRSRTAHAPLACEPSSLLYCLRLVLHATLAGWLTSRWRPFQNA